MTNIMKHAFSLTMLLISSSLIYVSANEDDIEDVEYGSALDPHPDPNDENYEGMIYIGRHDVEGRRVGFDQDNGEFA